ncbi:neprilysin-like [Tropilaelaps mercedesae]|uniref:Neprilysin-like n=1 Tax=Tropilaelaps mercedesae TaxID=418985 RepID=A0A1V9XVG7_9ACAR|nr:neprilysin-like [Tropilaelaps mercedesae]
MSRQRGHDHSYRPLVSKSQTPQRRNWPLIENYSIYWFCLICLGLLFSGMIFYQVYRAQPAAGNQPEVIKSKSAAEFHESPSEKRIRLICDSAVCRTVAFALNKTLNRDVDPCDDFYGFVCDGWRKRHPPERVNAKVSPFSLLASKISSIMQRGVRHSNQPWGKQNLQKVLAGGDANATFGPSIQVATFHQACIASLNDTEEAKAKKFLRRLLGQVGLTSLLSIDEVSKYDEEMIPTTAIETMISLSFLWGLPSLLMVYSMPDPTATSRNILIISASYKNDKESLRKVTPFIADESLDKFFEDSATAIKDFTTKVVHKSQLEVQKMSRLIAIVANILTIVNEEESHLTELNEIAKEIVLASLILDNSQNHSNWLLPKFSDQPKRMKLKDLSYITRSSSVDLLGTINKYVREHNQIYSKNEDVIIDSPRSLALLIMLLNDKNIEHAIKNYIAYSTIALLAPFVGSDARHRSAVLAQALGTVPQKFDVDRWCDYQAQEFLPLSYGAVFVREMVESSIKAEAQVVVDYVKAAFAEAMRENPWMDQSTRIRAMDKLRTMMAHVGFPDWFEDKLDTFIEARDLKPGMLFLDAVLRIKQQKVTSALRNFRKTNVRDINAWNFSPASLNAFYEHARNSITIPAAVLLFPFFTKGAPPAFNYGSLGSIVGHEVSHGFDTIGSNFDEEGNYIGWWTGKTKKKFNERNSCFVKQYEVLQNEILEGVHKSEIEKHGNAYKWCANIEARVGELMSLKDAHSTERLRCNAATMNIATFQEVFKCSAGAPMAPNKRCVTW